MRPHLVVSMFFVAACGSAPAPIASTRVTARAAAEQRQLAPEATVDVAGDVVTVSVVRRSECRADAASAWTPCGSKPAEGVALTLELTANGAKSSLPMTSDAQGRARFDLSGKRSSEDDARLVLEGSAPITVSLRGMPMRVASYNEEAAREEAQKFETVERAIAKLEQRLAASRAAAGMFPSDQWQDSDAVVNDIDDQMKHLRGIRADAQRLDRLETRWGKVSGAVDAERQRVGAQINCYSCANTCANQFGSQRAQEAACEKQQCAMFCKHPGVK